jgi:hypothetical protein
LSYYDKGYKETEALKSRLNDLSNYNDYLRSQLQQKTGNDLDDIIEIPRTYNEMNEWVKKYLAGRLVFLPRAIRSIKHAEYEDIDMVYKCLNLLSVSWG